MAIKYKVQSGDTLSEIASRYGVSISDISGYRSGNADLIFPDEVLNVAQKALTQQLGSPTGDLNLGADNDVQSTYNVPESVYGLGQDLLERKSKEDEILFQDKSLDELLRQQESEVDDIDMSKLKQLTERLSFLKDDRGAINTRLEADAEGRGIVGSALNPYSASELRKNALESFGVAQSVTALTGKKELELDLVKRKYEILTKPITRKIDVLEKELDYLDIKYKRRKGLLADIVKDKLVERKAQLALDKQEIGYRLKKELTSYKAQISRRQEDRRQAGRVSLDRIRQANMVKLKAQGNSGDDGGII